jgi:hypothetical protein
MKVQECRPGIIWTPRQKVVMHASYLSNVVNHLPIQEQFESTEEIGPRCWESLRALSQVVDIVDTKQAESRVCCCVIAVPVVLADAIRQAELRPLVGHRRVLGKYDVAREAEHFGWDACRLECLVIEANVPNARSAVLRVARSGRIEEELLAGGMSTKKCGKFVARYGFIVEEGDERVGAGSGIR